jgi:HD-like signal output (HDOD) protein/ActR/RegA family two-component response regulator
MRILFVDDDAPVLHGLRRLLHPMRHEWDMHFAGGGAEALALLGELPFDAVVSDMRMPGMDGAELLAEVQRRYPQIVRVVLSGQSDQVAILRSLGSTHQYLAKPCDPDTLKRTLERACGVRRLLADCALKKVVSQIGVLPSLPDVYVALVNECQTPDGSVRKVADIIAGDLAMTAQVLHLVNSAFFGQMRRISEPLQAVQILGLNTIKSLVLSAQVFMAFKPGKVPGFSLEAVQIHCLAASACARIIATAERCSPEVTADASGAALLLETGILVLAARSPVQYGEALRLAAARSLSLVEAEQEVFGATHAEVGAYLLGLWALPDPIVEAVAYHHAPGRCAHRAVSPLTIVHAAESIVRPAVAGMPDTDYLEQLGLADRLPVWQERWGRELARSAP